VGERTEHESQRAAVKKKENTFSKREISLKRRKKRKKITSACLTQRGKKAATFCRSLPGKAHTKKGFPAREEETPCSAEKG